MIDRIRTIPYILRDMDHFDETIAVAQEKLRGLELQVVETKRIINALCELAGRTPMYSSVTADETPALTAIKDDTFYGLPLATAITLYFKMRKLAGDGPASVAEIYIALKRGGYVFDAKNDDYAKRGLRNSLGKNTQTFHRLPSGAYGLREWYPAVKNARGKGARSRPKRSRRMKSTAG